MGVGMVAWVRVGGSGELGGRGQCYPGGVAAQYLGEQECAIRQSVQTVDITLFFGIKLLRIPLDLHHIVPYISIQESNHPFFEIFTVTCFLEIE